jgi:hypothetical protein
VGKLLVHPVDKRMRALQDKRVKRFGQKMTRKNYRRNWRKFGQFA